MVKSIYKITNTINGKYYIGQTNNLERRFREHRSCSQEKDKVLYRAIKKYGIENFTFEVLETDVENYNERERYWIDYYDSYHNGYNATLGGEEPPVFHGEEHHLAAHTQEEVNQIIEALQNTTLSTKEIAKQFHYDATTILRINRGELWYNENLTYPIRKESTKDFLKERAASIIFDLQNTDMTQKAIAEKYGMARSAITAINIGQNFHQAGIEYPIRSESKNRHSKAVFQIDKETNEIIAEFMSAAEAARAIGGNSSNIQKCLAGQINTAYGYKWKYKDN